MIVKTPPIPIGVVLAVLFAALAAQPGQAGLAQKLERASSAADRNRILDSAPPAS